MPIVPSSFCKNSFVPRCLFHFFVIVNFSVWLFTVFFFFFSTFLFVICCFTDKEISFTALSTLTSSLYHSRLFHICIAVIIDYFLHPRIYISTVSSSLFYIVFLILQTVRQIKLTSHVCLWARVNCNNNRVQLDSYTRRKKSTSSMHHFPIYDPIHWQSAQIVKKILTGLFR